MDTDNLRILTIKVSKSDREVKPAISPVSITVRKGEGPPHASLQDLEVGKDEQIVKALEKPKKVANKDALTSASSVPALPRSLLKGQAFGRTAITADPWNVPILLVITHAILPVQFNIKHAMHGQSPLSDTHTKEARE